ncbi:protein LSM14 homolog B-like isoform X2 [Tubulanus polymorphus]|uniref:protein LSM14 homolog B-like isoform X2 n=1 Tax=Tubulanus polymorphus TaxID=672921 RepID=UPI003DA4A044
MSGVPYIGSKISLISKAEIRYEGILYTIDAKEATVALQKVRSFGTEDRVTERPVPPREEVYEYIIFRGLDIKDLHVCEPPKSTPLASDPAIVKSSHPMAPHSHMTGYPSQQPGAIGSGAAGMYHQFGAAQPSCMPPSYSAHHPFPSQQQQQQQAPPVQASRGSTPPPNRSKSPATNEHQPAHSQQLQQQQQVVPRDKDSPNKDLNNKRQNQKENLAPHHSNEHHQYQQQQQHHHHHQQRREQSAGAHQMRGRRSDRGSPRGGGGGGGDRGGDRGERSFHNHNHRGYSSYRGQGPPQRRPRRGGPPGFGRPKSEPLRFDDDFDFESSNAQFDKEQLDKELKEKCNITSTAEKVVNGDEATTATTTAGSGDECENDENYYDKSRSFFDNISCEASERAKGVSQRPNWREERKMNAETFGISSTRELNRYRYRGGPRGRGGYRGRGRGRGGYMSGRGRGGPGGGGNRSQQPQQVAAQS